MKPLSSSQWVDAVHRQHVAGRGRERLRWRRSPRGGTRCSAALTVVSRIEGRSRPLSRASRDSVVMRCATMPGMRRDPVVGQAVPGREIPAARSRARRTRARATAPPCAARRGRSPGGSSPAAFGRAATARARSAMTSPSAPSATPASVSGRPATSMAAGDVAISRLRRRLMKARRACGTAACRIPAGTPSSPMHPGEQVVIRHLEQPLEIVEFGLAEVRDRGVGEAAEDQVGLAHAAMPGAEQHLAPPRVQAFARSGAAGHLISNAESPDGPGRGYIAGRSRTVRGDARDFAAAFEVYRIAMRPPVLNPLFAAITSLPGVGPKLEKLFRRLLWPRRTCRGSSTCCSICRAARSTGEHGRSCATSCPTRWSRSRSRSTGTARRRPIASRAPYQIYASDETGDIVLTFFNARRDYLEKLLPVGETALRLRHGRALRRHAADGASGSRGRRGRPRQACR